MECGVAIGLNPHGGNQLNVRELLRRLHPEPSADSDEGSDAGGMEDIPGGGGSAAEREFEPRRLRDDDYDYDDDFIDDAELVEEEEQPLDDGLPYDESADEDFNPEDEENGAEEGGKAKVRKPPPVHHAFGRFFVNKGDIPSKALLAPLPNPPDSIGNVSVKIPGLPAPTPPAHSTMKEVAVVPIANAAAPNTKSSPTTESGKRPPSASGGDAPPSGAPVISPPGPPNKKQKVEYAGASKSRKVIPAPVLSEILQLEQLCREEYGDKKPKTGDAKVQDRLAVFFREAMKAGVARLFSDIAKDRRLVALNDEVWQRLSRFIRTKRTTIEGLGHALHWRGKEIAAKSRVTTTEARVDQLLEQQRAAWPARTTVEQKALERPVVWGREVDERLFDWYRARSDLQLAKNQLGARVRSVKKSTPGWVSALKNRAFAGFAVSDQEVIDAFRRIEGERAALDKQKREAERAERKRRKEEQQALVAAKKAATANAKCATKPVPVSVGGGLPVNNADSAADTPTVIKVVPKPKHAVKNGATTKNGGVIKSAGGVKNGTGAGKNIPNAKQSTATYSSTPLQPSTVARNNASTKPLSKSPNTKAASTKPGSVKSSSGKIGSAKTTPTKMAPPSKQSKVTLGNSPVGSSPNAQKQTKLTSLVRKGAKAEGGASGARKPPSARKNVTTKDATTVRPPFENHSTSAEAQRVSTQTTTKTKPVQMNMELVSEAKGGDGMPQPGGQEGSSVLGHASTRTFEVIELD